ncbi:MAG: hypothetical protein RR260_05020, partial [Clostridia bacterium]
HTRSVIRSSRIAATTQKAQTLSGLFRFTSRRYGSSMRSGTIAHKMQKQLVENFAYLAFA